MLKNKDFECNVCGKTVKLKNYEKHCDTLYHRMCDKFADEKKLKDKNIKKEEKKIEKKVKFNNVVTTIVTPLDNKIIEKPIDIKELKKKKRQLKNSSFFITINTNQRINKLSEEYEKFIKKFKDVKDDLFNNYLNEIIIFKDDLCDKENDIKNVNTEYSIEVGEKTGCIHSHTLMKISHYTNIQINYKFITDFIKGSMNLPNIYLNNRVYYNNSEQNLKDYIEKTKK
jgi:hypothetical protein